MGFFFFFCRKLQHFLDRPHVCELCLGKRIACAYQRFLFSLAKWLRHNPGITTRVWLTMTATTFVASTVQHANSWFQVPRFPSLGHWSTLIVSNRHIRFWHVCAEVKVAPRKPHKQSPWSSPTWQITFFDFTSFVTCLDGRHAINSYRVMWLQCLPWLDHFANVFLSSDFCVSSFLVQDKYSLKGA